MKIVVAKSISHSFRMILSVLIATYFFISLARDAYAAAPTFPSCLNPQGNIKVSYSNGTHGIVGSTATYTGKDTVYTLSDTTLTQCFCSEKGDGIQTNWWFAGALTDQEIAVYKNAGWYYVPNGALWGLTEGPYLAKNSSYSCNSSVQGSSAERGVGGSSSGSVLGASSIADLASTGTLIPIAISFIAGLLFFVGGLIMRKQSRI